MGQPQTPAELSAHNWSALQPFRHADLQFATAIRRAKPSPWRSPATSAPDLLITASLGGVAGCGIAMPWNWKRAALNSVEAGVAVGWTPKALPAYTASIYYRATISPARYRCSFDEIHQQLAQLS